MMKVDMNPCAVCGSDGWLMKDGEYYSTRCGNSACSNTEYHVYDSKDAALKEWNEANPKEEA